MSSANSHRLSEGGLVDRSRPLSFHFDGQKLAGFEGDTLASALVANGVRLVGRSFKYHRPRGILTAGPEEPNALVELRTGARREPNTKATCVQLFEGLEALSQNRFPSLAFDLGAVNGLASPLLVAGFYYKTFKWPAAFWEKLYEPAIRRAAGLGRAAAEADPDAYEKAFACCDLLVVGSGPAGLSAALAAARSGARLILAEEDFVFGGRLNAETFSLDERPGADWARAVVEELASLENVRLMPRTSVFGVYDGKVHGALERVSDHLAVPPSGQPRQRLWQIVAKATILAAGAVERPIVFGGNDRPGIMTASSVRTYLNRFGAVPGRRVSIFTATDDGWRTLGDLGAAGIGVEAVIDVRPDVPDDLRKAAQRVGARLLAGGRVVATHGGRSLAAIEVETADGGTRRIETDCLAVSGGFNPMLALATHLGARPRYDETIAAFVPDATPPGMIVAGAAKGSLTLGAALREGDAAGRKAAEALGRSAPAARLPRAGDEPGGLAAFWHVERSRMKAFVDFQNDVTEKDIALAAQEGFRSVEHLKRYTTLGMATDQGRLSNLNGHAIMAELTGRSIPEAGTTMARPPYAPVAIGAFAGPHRGRHFRPTRLTAGHAFAAEMGASFIEAGQWLRAQWFVRDGETDWRQSVDREVRAVREAVGICDVSTLGKIEIEGDDAGEFLDRVYINGFGKLPVGKARYGVMLREDGFVKDDGTAAHLSPGRYVMSTTTANAASVMQHLKFCADVLWPRLDVALTSVTEEWAQYAIAGPRSRDLLQALFGEAVDLSNAAFPFMGAREVEWNGLPVRLFRISFSGELAYELAVPAAFGDPVLRALLRAGEAHGATLYGTEALGVLRIEKGHVAGNELNGTTTAADLGLGRMMSTRKDFVGRVLASRPGLVDPDRPRLVGIRPVDRTARIAGGAHFVPVGAEPVAANDEGYVTSVAFSPTLGHFIGLGLLKRGAERHGEHVRAVDLLRGTDVEVEICPPVFVDPEGARLHG